MRAEAAQEQLPLHVHEVNNDASREEPETTEIERKTNLVGLSRLRQSCSNMNNNPWTRPAILGGALLGTFIYFVITHPKTSHGVFF